MKIAELKIVKFNENDVISTSGLVLVTWSGIWDNIKGNAKLSYNGVSYSSSELSSLNNALSGTGISISESTVFNASMVTMTFAELTSTDGITQDNGDVADTYPVANSFNHAFSWDDGFGGFRKYPYTTKQ